jgi:hypothetical protein
VKKIFCFLFILLNYLSFAKAYVPKEGNISALLGPFVFKSDIGTISSNVNSPTLTGLGLIVLGDINDHGSLEIAQFFMPKIFYCQQNGSTVAEKMQLVHITMGYRRVLSPVFSISMALFSSYPMADKEIYYTRLRGSDLLDTSAKNNVNYGLDFSTQADLWMRGRYSVVVDTRYSWLLTAKGNEKSNHYGVLIGLKYLIQSKRPIQD